jgi:DNA invertase Pin-like site-specific DNA recombinase
MRGGGLSPTGKPKLPLAVYTRVSEQGRRSDEELLSHELQRRRVEKYLEVQNLAASAERFEDTDQSGRKMSRRAFDRAVAGVREGRLGGIAVAKLSRFGRNTVGILELIYEFEQVGAAVVCLDPTIDTSTASGRAMLTVFAAFVTLEAEQNVETAAQVAALKLENGTSLGGRPPVGYQWEILGQDSKGKDLLGWLVRREPEASVVADAFAQFASGALATSGRVADFLNEHDIPTSKGNRWTARTVRGLLARKAYVGVRSYGGRELADAHEAIVEPWIWRKVQRRLEPKAPTAPRSQGEGHVLGEGLVRCGLCGGGLVKGQANGKYAILRCNSRGRGHPSISYPRAEEWIAKTTFAKAVGWTVEYTGGNAAEIETADARLALAREALAEVEAKRGEWHPAAWGAAYSDALSAVEQAEDARAAIEVEPEQQRFLTAFGTWEKFTALPVPEKRRILHSLIERVTLLADTRGKHVAERIVITFSDGSWHPAHAAPGWQPPQLEGTSIARRRNRRT